jgi:hypothetical protein
MYTRRAYENLPWARLWLSHGARDNGSHTTYLVVRQCALAPLFRTDRSNELRLVPRPPTMYASGHANFYRGRPVAQPMGRDNGSHTTYLSGAMYFSPRISRTDRAMSSD